MTSDDRTSDGSKERNDVLAAVGRWWWIMTRPDGPRSGPRRAALARLRRAHTATEALSAPLLLELFGEPAVRTHIERHPQAGAARLVAACMVLAHVREDDRRQSVGRAIGRPSLDQEDGAAVSEARFRRLLLADEDELVEAFRRLVHLMGGRANVRDLVALILFWSETVRTRLIFDYYAVGHAAPQEATAAAPAPD